MARELAPQARAGAQGALPSAAWLVHGWFDRLSSAAALPAALRPAAAMLA